MYEYFCALIIGIVEGLTEYIPVSSTGHMIIVGNMINFTGELANVFDVFIQLGAILSVVVVYRQKFLYILDTHHWFRKKRSIFDESGNCHASCLCFRLSVPRYD